MSIGHKPLTACAIHLEDALKDFQNAETNEGLEHLTMALQELVGWADQIDERLKQISDARK